MLGKDAESPFALQFNTDNYPPGQHTYHAVGVLADGSEISSNELTAKVLSEEDSMSRTLTIVGPILGITLIGILLGVVVPALMGKKGKPGPIGDVITSYSIHYTKLYDRSACDALGRIDNFPQ